MKVKKSFEEIKKYYQYVLSSNKLLLNMIPSKDNEKIEIVTNRIDICKTMLSQINYELKVLKIAEKELYKEKFEN